MVMLNRNPIRGRGPLMWQLRHPGSTVWAVNRGPDTMVWR